jgi:uncharacterized phage protein gp47/JayE
LANPYFLTWQEVLDQLLSFLPPSWRASFTGKVLKRLLVAFALATEALYALLARLLRLSIIATSEGAWLKALVAGLSMTSYQGTAATVAVEFRRYSAGGTVAIPQNAKVGAVYGQSYQTVLAVVLPDQERSVLVPCRCTEPGSQGRIRAGEIISLITPVAGIDEVSNPNDAEGGLDPESDAEIKARLPKHLATLHRATIPATENAIALNREQFPEVRSFLTQRNYGTRGYFRGILSDYSGSDLYRPGRWTAVGGGVYFVPTGLTEVNGLVAAGFPCQRFGIPERLPDGEEIWRASTFVAEVEAATWRFCHDRALGRLYAKADGQDLNNFNITIYSGVVWRVLRTLETEWAANGVFLDVLVPFTVKAEVNLTYTLEPGYRQTDVETALRNTVSSYVRGLQLGQSLELEGLYSAIALIPGAGGVLVVEPISNISVPADSVFRLSRVPQISRRAA